MTGAGASTVERAVADAHRREWSFVLAATARVARDLDLAEECVQDAYLKALDAWARDGVPAKPGAWLTTTAKRRALDVLRREQVFRSKVPLLVEPDEAPDEAAMDDPTGDVVPDDRLRLIFTCCHPALAREAQVALTLRLICGMSTPEIAQAFLVSEPTMAARITRAKKKISGARIPYRVPAASELPDRLDAVLTVIHLLYTTGHTAPAGDRLLRGDAERPQRERDARRHRQRRMAAGEDQPQPVVDDRVGLRLLEALGLLGRVDLLFIHQQHVLGHHASDDRGLRRTLRGLHHYVAARGTIWTDRTREGDEVKRPAAGAAHPRKA